MKKNKNQRTRNWSIIVYPESAPENWIDILQKEYVKMVVSPLHDKDVNPDDTLKKAHYHVLFMFDGVKSYNQVKSIADSVNAPIPQIDRKSTRLNSSHVAISYAVFCMKKKNN